MKNNINDQSLPLFLQLGTFKKNVTSSLKETALNSKKYQSDQVYNYAFHKPILL